MQLKLFNSLYLYLNKIILREYKWILAKNIFKNKENCVKIYIVMLFLL